MEETMTVVISGIKKFTMVAALGVLSLSTAHSATPLISNDFGGTFSNPTPGQEWGYMGYMFDAFNVIRDGDVLAGGGSLNMRNSTWHVNRLYNTSAMPNSTITTVDFRIDALPTLSGQTFGVTINDAQGTTLPPSVQGAITARIEKQLNTDTWRLVAGVAFSESTINSGNPSAVEFWPIVTDAVDQIPPPIPGNEYRLVADKQEDFLYVFLYDLTAGGELIGEVFATFDGNSFGSAFPPALNQGVASLLLINREFNAEQPDFLAVTVNEMKVEDTRSTPVTIFLDSFDQPLSQPRWHTNPDRRFEPGGTVFGVWPEGLLDSRKPNVDFDNTGINLRGYDIGGQFYARAPIGHNFRYQDMDLVAKFTLVEANSVGSEPPGFFGAKIRVGGDELPHFVCAVRPGSSTIAMGPGTGFNTFNASTTAPLAVGNGQQVTLLIQAQGSTVRYAVSLDDDLSTVDAYIETSSAAPIATGFINFAAQNIQLARFEEFAVYEFGKGGFPASAGFVVVPDGIPGDVNADGEVNVADVTDLGNFLKDLTGSLADPNAADLNEDGTIDEVDLDLLVDLIVND
jgi:hypothetical protein